MAAPHGAAPGERPKPTEEPGAEGKPQLVIPGTERITEAEQAQRGAERPVKPKAPQKPADERIPHGPIATILLRFAPSNSAIVLRDAGISPERFRALRPGEVGL
jgi:hypothetical protein